MAAVPGNTYGSGSGGSGSGGSGSSTARGPLDADLAPVATKLAAVVLAAYERRDADRDWTRPSDNVLNTRVRCAMTAMPLTLHSTGS